MVTMKQTQIIIKDELIKFFLTGLESQREGPVHDGHALLIQYLSLTHSLTHSQTHSQSHAVC